MLKIDKRCKTCMLIAAGDKKLEQRINRSKMWIPGNESLLAIHKDLSGKQDMPIYEGFLSHAKKHQAPSDKSLAAHKAEVALKEIKGEVAIAKVKYTHHTVARREVLEKLMQAIENDDMKLTGNMLTNLLKQESDIEEKSKDRSLEMMKMFNYFASGANSTTNKPKSEGGKNFTVFEGEGEELRARDNY